MKIKVPFVDQAKLQVASYTEAWIENFNNNIHMIAPMEVASYTEAWIEKSTGISFAERETSRFLYGGVD